MSLTQEEGPCIAQQLGSRNKLRWHESYYVNDDRKHFNHQYSTVLPIPLNEDHEHNDVNGNFILLSAYGQALS
jgi:hypothetical protein